MKEIPRRIKTVMSSLKEISTDQLGNIGQWWWWEGGPSVQIF
jgi:hypothetical protein